jgi:hypothetical protein
VRASGLAAGACAWALGGVAPARGGSGTGLGWCLSARSYAHTLSTRPHLARAPPPGIASNEGLGSLLLVGRQDYTVKSLRVDSREETWNATFARMQLLHPGGAVAGVRSFLESDGGSALEPPLLGRQGEGEGQQCCWTWACVAAGFISGPSNRNGACKAGARIPPCQPALPRLRQ